MVSKAAIQLNIQKSMCAHTAAVPYMGTKKPLAILFTTKFIEPNLFRRMLHIFVNTAKCISSNFHNKKITHQLRSKHINNFYD